MTTYEQGWNAFFDGGSESDNPFASTDSNHYKWHKGFIEARFNSQL